MIPGILATIAIPARFGYDFRTLTGLENKEHTE